MAGKIQTMIPQYGELNRIYRDYIDNYAFSFDRQKFISDFYQEYNDMKSFEAAILELVLDKQKEQYTLILNSLKTEIEKSIQAYEIRPLSDRAIERACYQHMERYSQEIEAQLDVTRSLSKPLNEANNRYDSIGYREHTAEEEKQAEKEYERCKAEYDREKAKLNKLYDQQKATRTEAFQYMKNCCADIYRQSCLFLDILKKYIPDGKQENKSSEPISQQETTEEQQEYFRDRNPFAYDLHHYANAGYCFRFGKGYRGRFGCSLEVAIYGRAPKSTGQMRGVRRLFTASIKRNTGVFSTNERQG